MPEKCVFSAPLTSIDLVGQTHVNTYLCYTNSHSSFFFFFLFLFYPFTYSCPLMARLDLIQVRHVWRQSAHTSSPPPCPVAK